MPQPPPDTSHKNVTTNCYNKSELNELYLFCTSFPHAMQVANEVVGR